MSKKVSKQKVKKMKLIGLITSFFLVISSIIFYIFVIGADVLPFKYLAPLITICVIFVLLFVNVMLRRKFRIWLKCFCIFLSIVLIIIFIGACVYINKTYSFLDKIQARDMVTENYYVMILNDSKYSSLKDLEGKKVGTYDEKLEIYNNAIDILKKEVSVELVNYDSVDTMAHDLIGEEIDAIILSTYHKDIVTESLTGFSSSCKVLDTIESKVKNTSIIEHKDIDVTNETFTIYISGIDQYGDISLRSRSDVNMLVTINPKNYEILLTSIPRDYYVKLHDTTGYRDKLTHAGIYGVDMSLYTIEDLLDIDIDYYFRINFSTLVDVVDTIGGIDVYSDQGFTPLNYKHLYIEKGMNHMDGEMALAFARERYAYSTGDRHRVQNQQDVLTAIINKITKSTTLLTKYSTLLEQLSSSFETNINFKKTIAPLVKLQLDKMPNWTIKKYSLNGSDAMDYTYSTGSQKLYVMIPDDETVDKASSYIKGMEDNKSFAELNISNE